MDGDDHGVSMSLMAGPLSGTGSAGPSVESMGFETVTLGKERCATVQAAPTVDF